MAYGLYALFLQISHQKEITRGDRRSREVAEIQEALAASPCAMADVYRDLSANWPICVADHTQRARETEVSGESL